MTIPEKPGCGFKPEPPRKRDQIASAARGVKVGMRAGALALQSALPRAPWLELTQGRLEDCQGVFAAQGGWLLLGAKLSAEFCWLYARGIDAGGIKIIGPDGLTNLENEGTTTSALVRACEKHGLCPHEKWNRTREDYNLRKLPPALVRAQAQKWKLDIRQIFATGDTLVNRHCDSIHQGYPAQIIVQVDEEFDRLQSPIGPSTGPSRGSHAVVGFEYRTRADGRREIRVFTWGRTVWLSPERVGEMGRGAYLKGMVQVS